MSKAAPSMDAWLKEAKEHESAPQVGMYLFHNGVVRRSPQGPGAGAGGAAPGPSPGMLFSYDREKLDAAIAAAREMEGIFYIRVWLNEGELSVGDDIMLVLIGGDIRPPHVVDALQYLVGRIKDQCVSEQELR